MTGARVSSPMGQFLTGLRVLDLSQYIPGPMATLYLADFGAEVIKIEPPSGDQMQQLGPRDKQGRPLFYQALNAGKQVVALNLKDAGERARFLEMVRDADVVVEGFRPGVMARLGIDYPVLCAANARIILCSISGYGAGSSLAARAGHDANYLAMNGVMSRNGRDMPAFFDPPVADVAGALFAATAILAALHGRHRSGQGCVIDLALADTLMPLQLIQVADYGENRTIPRAGETYLNGGAAYYSVYATLDGRHVVLGAVEPKFWHNFCTTAGRPDWNARHDDPIPQIDLQAEIGAWFRTRSAPEIMDLFGQTDCCLSLVQDLSEALATRHTAERGLVRRAPDGALQALFPILVNSAAPDTREPLQPFTAQARSPAIPAPLRADPSSGALHRTRE